MAILTQSSSSTGGPLTGWHLGDQLAPAGQHLAVCVAVKDSQGVERPTYENPAVLETVDLTRFLFGTVVNGAPMLIQTSEMKISGHEKSKLVAVLTGWLGRPPLMDGTWDYCTMEGQGATLTVVQKTSQKGRIYADVQSVAPVMEQLAGQVPPVETFSGLLEAASMEAPAPQVTTQTFTAPAAPAPQPATVPHLPDQAPSIQAGAVPFHQPVTQTMAFVEPEKTPPF